MNRSNTKSRRRLTGFNKNVILCLIIAAILLGALFDFILGTAEKKMYPREYALFVMKYSAEFGVPEAVIYAVIKTESDFKSTAVSSATPPALGLMQLTAETYEWVAGKLKEPTNAFGIYDPNTNIRYGVWYLSYLYGRFENWDTAFAAYNAGPGNVSKWLNDPEYSSDGKTLDYIPFKETRNYVVKVNSAIKVYERLYYSE